MYHFSIPFLSSAFVALDLLLRRNQSVILFNSDEERKKLIPKYQFSSEV
jgi:hypothetical protein